MRVSSKENRVARWRPAVWIAALRERSAGQRNAFLLKDIEALQQQLANPKLRSGNCGTNIGKPPTCTANSAPNCSVCAWPSRLFEASVGLSADDDEGTSALTRLLRLVMETVEAGGGVLWLRADTGNRLVPQVCEGRVGGAVHLENSKNNENVELIESILRVDTLSPTELRAHCEVALQRSAPAAPLPAYTRRSAQTIHTALLTDEAVVSTQRLPVLTDEGAAVAAVFGAVASLELQATTEFALIGIGKEKESESASPSVAILALRVEEAGAVAGGQIIGVVGLCDPRGQSRFTSVERERLQSLSRPLSAALRNVLQRADTNRRLNEMSNAMPNERLARRDRNALLPHASEREAVYQNIVARVMQAVPCENCTLFLLDAAGQRLEARATQGRVVNLLDHIGFARGHGVSGWVAAQGRPLHIADLTQEPGLLHIEAIPPRVRSFLAVPLRADGEHSRRPQRQPCPRPRLLPRRCTPAVLPRRSSRYNAPNPGIYKTNLAADLADEADQHGFINIKFLIYLRSSALSVSSAAKCSALSGRISAYLFTAGRKTRPIERTFTAVEKV